MNYYALKLLPCRPTFAQDMTEAERAIMQQHQVYWRGLMGEGKVVVLGPVLGPAAVYGLGVIRAADTAEVDGFIERDPAIVINQYEYHQILAVLL